MKYFLFYSVALTLLTACSEDKPQKPTIETTTQPEQQINLIAEQHQETPKTLSGDEQYMGPNPHAKLSSEQHIAVALQHAEDGRMAEALDIISRAITVNPTDASLRGALGGLLLSQDRVSEALVYLEEAVSLAPDSAVLLVNRSQAYRKLNRLQLAMSDLDKAVALSPKLVPARFNRGVLLYDKANYEEALADFDICIQIAPETPGPYFNRAIVRDAQGDKAGAVSDMNSFIALSDNPEWNKVARETMAAWKNESDL